MARISQEYEMTIRNHIRRLLIMDGAMTNVEISKQLGGLGIHCGLAYVAKQRYKIIKSKEHNRLNYTLTTYLQHFIDTLSELDRKLWQIATDKSVPERTRVGAMKEIRENRSAIFDKLFEAGVFTKQLGNLNITSFMDFVKTANAGEYGKIIDAKTTDGIPEALEGMAERSGGVRENVLGQGLVDLVRASKDPEVGSEKQVDSGA